MPHGDTASIHSSIFSKLVPHNKLGTLSCISLIVNKIIGTGIFLNPSPIFQYLNGNVGLFLLFFIIGGIIIFSGLLIYLEFALNLPFKNGGELNYLIRVIPNPRGLIGCVYSFSIVLLGFSSGNSFAFGKYVLYAATGTESVDDNLVKLIGVGCITFCCFLHMKYPKQGSNLFNFLGIFKILILVLIIFIGVLAFGGFLNLQPTDNFKDIWAFHEGTKPSIYSISVALLEVIYSFKGWENVNYVLNEVDDPYHILTVAAPLAVLLTTVLYFMVILAYLVVVPKDEMLSSGVLIAGIFFNKVFGASVTARLLPILISFSNLGNVLVVSYAHSVVNQELAYNNYIPFSCVFQNFNYSLMLHWLVTVVVLVAPPSSEIYEFIVNLYIYPGTWINVILTAGLLYLKFNKKKENWGEFHLKEDEELSEDGSVVSDELQTYYPHRSETDPLLPPCEFKPRPKIISTPYVCVFIFLIANIFLAVFPFVQPPNAASLDIPYWMFPVLGTGVLVLGAVFYYIRPYVTKKDIKYESDYIAS
ncbi:High-affinity methionine permease [Candida viswanathii]|uniref:High-affinity methionine permease n=1 Tax=Candida viswanathii TaxID=5486 RepID=A0A367Y0V4_9ASCO|nr:High-affinity methionine permease [Candida viswanathii]